MTDIDIDTDKKLTQEDLEKLASQFSAFRDQKWHLAPGRLLDNDEGSDLSAMDTAETSKHFLGFRWLPEESTVIRSLSPKWSE